jgi:hypothetical protein
MKLFRAVALALIVSGVFCVTGCGAGMDSEQVQQQVNEKQTVDDYQKCVSNHPSSPGMCEYLKAKLYGAPVVAGPSNR